MKKYWKKLSKISSKGFFAVFFLVAMAGFFVPNHATAAFIHPGVLSTAEELSFIKAKVQQGAQPWKGAYDMIRTSSFGSLAYTPHPHAVVECGYYSNPNIGCTDETNDAKAAYTHALLWYLNGNQAHAQKAIEIMNAWSAIMTGHTNANAPLQAAWSGSVFPRAAEIIRYTYTGWSASDILRFSNMLKNAYLPNVTNQNCGYPQNWNLSFIEAMTHISVFNNDQQTFDRAMTRWRSWVPGAYYMESDGARVSVSGCGTLGYYGATTFVDGLCQETCRDLGHMQYGLAAMIDTAETARHQGIDLYAEQSNRIITSMEFHAGYILGQAVPSWLCGGVLNLNSGRPTWEIAYNHYHNRLGISLPKTSELINTIRPTDEEFHMVWETLTHAELGNTGSVPPSDTVAPAAPSGLRVR